MLFFNILGVQKLRNEYVNNATHAVTASAYQAKTSGNHSHLLYIEPYTTPIT